jgi:hypothetical protein
VRIRVLFYSAHNRRNIRHYEAEYLERRALLELPELAERMRKDLVRFPTAALRIESEPAGALAYVNGVFVGRTPLSLPAVAATNHVVFIKQDGYLEKKSALQLTAGGNFVHRAVLESIPGDASLTVTSTPPGATVLIDLVRKGKTPLVLSNMRPGDYRVQVELDDHHRRLVRARLVGGRMKTLSLPLDPIVPGEMSIEERIDNHRKWMNVFFWSGAGSLIVYGVLYFNYEDYQAQFERSSRSADSSKAKNYHKAANIALGVTVATLATSSYFLIRYLLADDKELGMAPVDTRTFYAALGPNEVYLNWRF